MSALLSPLRVSTLLATALMASLAVGCEVGGNDEFEDAFNSPDGGAAPAPSSEPADDGEEDEPADEPTMDEPADDDDTPPAPSGFAHAGEWTGICTLTDREPFQVDLNLDDAGEGFLRRHDVGPVELDAMGMTDGEGVSVILAVRAGVVFRVHLYPEAEGGVEAECLELVEAEGEGDGLDCMFPEIGCPHEEQGYAIAASGELVIERS